MENKDTNQLEIETEQKSQLHQVTILSKYFAILLFILLPFLGGWVGYTYAPEKVVEVENIVRTENSIKNKGIDLSVKYSMKVQKGDFEYELVGSDGPTDVSGNNLSIRNLNTGEVVKTKYWFRFSDELATIGNDSFILVGTDNGGGTNVGLQVVKLTSSGVEVRDVPLPAGLTATEQILCEMGCRRGVNWEVDFKDGLPVLVVELYNPKTYNELAQQYMSLESSLSEKKLIDQEMRKMNFVEKYQFEL